MYTFPFRTLTSICVHFLIIWRYLFVYVHNIQRSYHLNFYINFGYLFVKWVKSGWMGTEWTAENDNSIEINKIIQFKCPEFGTRREREATSSTTSTKVVIWFWSDLWCAIKFSFHVLPRIIATFNFNQLPIYMSTMLFKVAPFYSLCCLKWMPPFIRIRHE